MDILSFRKRVLVVINTQLTSDDITEYDYLLDDIARRLLKLPALPIGNNPYEGWLTKEPEKSSSSMRISQAGIELVKKWEGCRTDAYLCPAGIWTIGYGHTASAIPGMTINQLEAENLLKVDLERFEVAVCRLVKVQLTQNQFDALVSFTYNVGAEAFRKSTLLVKLNANQLQAAAKQFRRWVTANGKELPGLVKRRKEEEALFLSA